ncbi:PREDICTED: protein EFR3 homolog B [Ipomoea nil]|uniref:protein EFR3 homolog B n=1 Tax=Ipomoea nil TaxID=35883 RepID=UPI000901BFDF|nr:PREDICTED: protein EFR3 homolog B [Ipomoea nil]
MGLLSRKLFPACESMCICCPALRSRSRQPVKRYKKLLADIFPKSPDGSANGRKIMKLCEYAAKNPFRIPKIAKCLEERCYKELRSGHTKLVNVIAEVYNELLCMCKEQMACFAVNLLNVVVEMLDCAKTDAVKTIGCLTFTKFIYSQVDGTYTYNIENLVQKVCSLARETGEEDQKRCLRASSLRCLSAMVWFMAEFSHIFADFDEIVHVTLDNYEPDAHNEDDERGEAHHNWVDEVIRSEGRDVGNENRPGYLIRKRPDKKDISLLTSEEIEMPKIWAHICIQRMADLAKESSTMRRVLDPMFIHFDNNKHWVPRHGLAFVVLSDLSYFVESSGNHQLILTGVVRHLDHKNVACDSQIKSFVIQTATALARQIRSGGGFSDIGFVSDLCRHLRKSLQATVDLAGEEINLNLTLQTSIQECLLETAKGILDARPLFDMMAMTLEKLPSHKVVARATMGSLIILAHTISIASLSSNSQQVFPDELFIQLLRVMLHPDVEIRIGGHHIFSVLLVTSSNYMRHDAPSHTRRWNSSGASTFSSITALLDKLRREKDATKEDNIEEERKQGRAQRNSPNFHKLNSIIDRTVASASLTDTDPSTLKLNEDQITQLLSAFWVQANLSDNLPANVEAITQSFCLTLISLRLRNTENNLVVRFFQLPLSLLKIALEPNESMSPAYQRLLLVSSTAMLSFVAKMCQVSDLNTLLKPLRDCNLDPFLGVGDDYQVYMKPRADLREYGSTSDNQTAAKFLSELRNKSLQSLEIIQSTLVESLSRITQLETDDLVKEMSEGFTPDDTFLFGLQSMVDMDHIQVLVHSRESPSYDGDFLTNSSAEDDKISESSVTDMTRFMPTSPSPSSSRIVNIGQLLESALEVAGQVAGTFVSTSPLPYGAMASQCETLGTDTRKKLSNWLAHENHYTKAAADVLLPAIPGNGLLTAKKTIDEDSTLQQGVMVPREPWLAIRLPPASPFDNFLRAARR